MFFSSIERSQRINILSVKPTPMITYLRISRLTNLGAHDYSLTIVIQNLLTDFSLLTSYIEFEAGQILQYGNLYI